MYDILIKNGKIVDGTGKPSFQGSLGIKNNKIVGVGNISGLSKKTIDAGGAFVVPGFIDVLTHSDVFLNIFNNPSQESFLQQGITTIIGGNCGASLAPLVGPESIRSIKKWADIESITMNWAKMSEFLNTIKRLRLGVNFGTLVGYSTIRCALQESGSESLSAEDLKKIELILKDALRGGALGISVGLSIPERGEAHQVEMVKLGQMASRYNKVLSVHLKDEGEGITASINEILQVAEETKASVEFSHFKILSPNVSAEKAVSLIENAASDGTNVNFDVYPYNASAVALFSLLPEWAREGGSREMIKRLKDSETRSKIIKDLKKINVDIGNILLSHTGRNKFFLNKTISEIADKDNVSIEEALLNIIIISDTDAAGFLHSKNENSISALLKSKLALVSSDGSGSAMAYDTARNQLVHPRNFGAFPYAIGRYVREEKILKIEEMISKMTSLPAKKYNLSGRGFLAKNYFADVCILDLNSVGSRSTFANPFVYPDGIIGAIVNGKIALWDKKIVGSSCGEILL